MKPHYTNTDNPVNFPRSEYKMNQRIRELIEQAHEQNPVIVLDPETYQPTHKIGNGGVPMYRSELNPEKLAELIVRECANLAMNQRHSTSPDDYDEMNPYRQGCDDMASFISGLIRRAFGVAE